VKKLKTEFQEVVEKMLKRLETELRFYGAFGKKLEVEIQFPDPEKKKEGWIHVKDGGGYVVI